MMRLKRGLMMEDVLIDEASVAARRYKTGAKTVTFATTLREQVEQNGLKL